MRKVKSNKYVVVWTHGMGRYVSTFPTRKKMENWKWVLNSLRRLYDDNSIVITSVSH